MTDVDLAYIAGIIDGEGCITIQKSHKKRCSHASYQPMIVVLMTSEPVIRYLTNKIDGGWFTIAQPRPNNRQTYRFVVTGNNAYSLLERARQYMVEKQNQVDKILELRQYCKGQGYRPTPDEVSAKDAIFTELKSMHL